MILRHYPDCEYAIISRPFRADYAKFRVRANATITLALLIVFVILISHSADAKATSRGLTVLAHARQLRSESRFTDSVHEYRLALRALSVRDTETRSQVMNELSQLYLDLSRFREAHSIAKQALAIEPKGLSSSARRRTLAIEGSALVNLGGTRQGLADIEQSLELARDATDGHDEANGLYCLGNAYLSGNNPNPDKALHFLQEAMKIQIKLHDLKGQAQIAVAEMYAAYVVGDSKSVISESGKTLELSLLSRNKLAQEQALIVLGNAYEQSRKEVKAVNCLNHATTIAENIQDNDGQATALVALAQVEIGSRNFDEAASQCQQAIYAAQTVGDSDMAANGYFYLGTCFLLQCWYEIAVQAFQDSIRAARLARDQQIEGAAFGDKGVAYEGLGDFKDSLACCQKAFVIERSIPSPEDMGVDIGNAGQVYLDLGQYNRSLSNFEKAVNKLKPFDDSSDTAAFFTGMGRCYRYLKQYDKAISYQKKALALAVSNRNWRIAGTAEGNLGEVYWLLKQDDKAEGSLSKAIDLAKRSNNMDTEQWALANSGNVSLDEGHVDTAEAYFRRAVGVARLTNSPRAEAYFFYRLMESAKAQGRTYLAVFYGKEAVNTYQRMRRNIKGFGKDTRGGFLHSHEEVYRSLAEILITQGRLSEARQVLAMLKEEEYFDYLQGNARGSASSLAGLDLTDEEERWESRYERIASSLTYAVNDIAAKRDKMYGKLRTGSTLGVAARLSSFSNKIPIRAKQLQAVLLATNGAFRKSEMASEAGGLEDSLRKLSPGTVVLYTIVEPDKVRTIVVTRQHTVARQYAIRSSDLYKIVLQFRAALQNPEADPRAVAEKLYDVLIQPIDKDLKLARAHILMWSLDDALRYIPIAALYDGHHYLVERYDNEVFTLASENGLTQRPRSHWRVLGLGVSKPHGIFPPLPAVPQELSDIIEQTPNTFPEGILPGKILLDQSFTKTAMLRWLRARYQVVHIASHFELDSDDAHSFLLLGDGRHLTVAQINTYPNLFTGVDLLTLSACNTALDMKTSKGREIEGLGAMAQRLGARSVLASLWPVSDSSTRRLMVSFYHFRQKHPNASKAEALRQAQLALLGLSPASIRSETTKVSSSGSSGVQRSAPDTVYDSGISSFDKSDSNHTNTHPYYWAPFIMIGNWQ